MLRLTICARRSTRLCICVNCSRQRVGAKLDEKEREMLRISIDSMERLGTLMNALLAYSETGNVPQQRTMVSLDDPLRIALANLQHHIDESGATITIGELPT